MTLRLIIGFCGTTEHLDDSRFSDALVKNPNGLSASFFNYIDAEEIQTFPALQNIIPQDNQSYKIGFNGPNFEAPRLLGSSVLTAAYAYGVQENVQKAVDVIKWLSRYPFDIEIICFGTSRGAVSCLLVPVFIQQTSEEIKRKINSIHLIMCDPVPGNFIGSVQTGLRKFTITDPIMDLSTYNIRSVLILHPRKDGPPFGFTPLLPLFTIDPTVMILPSDHLRAFYRPVFKPHHIMIPTEFVRENNPFLNTNPFLNENPVSLLWHNNGKKFMIFLGKEMIDLPGNSDQIEGTLAAAISFLILINHMKSFGIMFHSFDDEKSRPLAIDEARLAINQDAVLRTIPIEQALIKFDAPRKLRRTERALFYLWSQKNNTEISKRLFNIYENLLIYYRSPIFAKKHRIRNLHTLRPNHRIIEFSAELLLNHEYVFFNEHHRNLAKYLAEQTEFNCFDQTQLYKSVFGTLGTKMESLPRNFLRIIDSIPILISLH